LILPIGLVYEAQTPNIKKPGKETISLPGASVGIAILRQYFRCGRLNPGIFIPGGFIFNEGILSP